jgi:hypothetical protein
MSVFPEPCKWVIPFLLLATSDAQSQALYAECAGNSAGYFTVNYEHLLSKSGKNVWSVHGGFGMYDVKDQYKHKSFPLGVTYYNRKEGNSHKEVGLCLNYVEGVSDNSTTWSLEGVQYSKALVLIANVGYRYMKPEGGFIFKIYYSPAILLKEFEDPPYYFPRQTFFPRNIGIGLGYNFRRCR